MEAAYSDRVEIFFRQDNLLSPYYCLEMDPIGRVFDYEARYHRKFNVAWNWPENELLVKADQTHDGYTIEGRISKQSLRQLGLLNSEKLEVGLFRGECINLNAETPEIKWISWVKPDSMTPDFHIPSAFGVLHFM